LKNREENWTEITIKDIISHPDFNRIPNAAYNNVAILKLKKGVVFSDTIRPICLPEPSAEVDHLAGVIASVSGWGANDADAVSASETLKTAHKKVYQQRYDD